MATTTPNYGWPVPTSTDFVKDGATAIEALGDAIDATVFGLDSGLALISATTIGTAVSSVTVTDAFSASYDNYKIIISGGVGSSSNAQLDLTFGATATGYKFAYGIFGSGSATGTRNDAASSITVSEINTNVIQMNTEVFNPFLAKHTYVNGYIGYNIANLNGRSGLTGLLENTTSYTAFTLTANAGTITGGTIAVYGYVK